MACPGCFTKYVSKRQKCDHHKSCLEFATVEAAQVEPNEDHAPHNAYKTCQEDWKMLVGGLRKEDDDDDLQLHHELMNHEHEMFRKKQHEALELADGVNNFARVCNLEVSKGKVPGAPLTRILSGDFGMTGKTCQVIEVIPDIPRCFAITCCNTPQDMTITCL